MDQQNQRQNVEPQPAPPVRTSGRITRGFSDLPKQQPKVQSEEESQEEEISQGTPKVKKIHHMTLKKLQRLEKLAEMQRLGLIPPKPVVQKLPPRKRGRPKGVTKKVVVQSEPSSFVEQVQDSINKAEKKEFTLRKRENNKKMIEEESVQPIEEEKNQKNEKSELKPIEIQIQIPQVPPKQIPKPQQTIAVVPPPAPKKRGRKKKVQPQIPQNQPLAPQGATNAKVFTVPKAQTYDNYNKYYNKLLQQTKESQQKQVPLIFDKFSDPEGYKAMLSYLKNDHK